MMNGPKVWNKLLSEAPAGSVIMGGAVVDYMFGHKPNDIDIFHEYQVGVVPVPKHWGEVEADFNNQEWLAKYQQDHEANNPDHHNVVGSVYTYNVPMWGGESLKVQLIGVMYIDPLAHFADFDHSLTLGRYTKNGLFIHRKVFDTMASHDVEYVCKDHSPHRVARALERAKAKTKRYSGGHEGNWTFKGFVAHEKAKDWW